MNIIFDLGGVLIDLDMPGMRKACEAHGLNPDIFFVKSDKEHTSAVCNGMSARSVISDYQVGRISDEVFVENVLAYAPEGMKGEEVIALWNTCLGNIPRERLELIRQLRSRGHRTYMLSNTNELHWRYIEETFFTEKGFTVSDLFDDVFLSQRMHLAKPDPEIYRETLSRIGCDASDCVFIDDSAENIKAACAEGIRGLWLDLTKEDVIALVSRSL